MLKYDKEVNIQKYVKNLTTKIGVCGMQDLEECVNMGKSDW
jgi:hypothetical protein